MSSVHDDLCDKMAVIIEEYRRDKLKRTKYRLSPKERQDLEESVRDAQDQLNEIMTPHPPLKNQKEKLLRYSKKATVLVKNLEALKKDKALEVRIQRAWDIVHEDQIPFVGDVEYRSILPDSYKILTAYINKVDEIASVLEIASKDISAPDNVRHKRIAIMYLAHFWERCIGKQPTTHYDDYAGVQSGAFIPFVRLCTQLAGIDISGDQIRDALKAIYPKKIKPKR